MCAGQGKPNSLIVCRSGEPQPFRSTAGGRRPSSYTGGGRRPADEAEMTAGELEELRLEYMGLDPDSQKEMFELAREVGLETD